jgi:HAE1 family hydrophobic/amphiphilic exporter-1
MFAKFLHRPALAIVISILILFLGALAIKTLPISQFPSVAPPSVVISLSFPGASAEVLVDSVLIILEQAINGVQDMRYMASAATSAGEAAIQVIFEPGTDPNVAVVNVNNRINIVKNRLPPIVEREGIIVMQAMTSMLMYVNVYSTDKGLDQNFLYNYVSVNVLPEIKRTRGIGSANILGNRAYAMRIFLDQDRMRAYRLSAADVMEMIAKQSMIGSPGRLGQATGKTSQTVEYVLTWVGRYNRPEQYENIILRANPDGEILKIKDVAKVELGSSFYDLYSDIDGNPSAAIVLKQSPGSNAAVVIEQVKEKLEQIKEKKFPPGMDFEVSYDVSAFLEASIEKVLHTLFEAFVLVALVVFLFLGDWRSTLIPTLAVPVSLIGTFFFMLLFGLSINLITLFALVLAIGVVVDDAIVVVEAVHAKMAEKHLSPYKATKEVVHEISGAIIAITMVMTAVFVPVTFMTGPVGVFYRQFGLTMAMSIVLSGVVALTLTPVLCAMLLKPHGSNQGKWRGPLAILLHLFDRAVEKVTGGYAGIVRRIVTRRMLTMMIITGFGYGIFVVNTQLSSGFIPLEDQGMIYGIIQTPPGSTLEYTNSKAEELQKIARETEGVKSVSSLAGYEVLTEGRGSNAGTCLINLKNWSDRKMTSKEIIAKLEEEGAKISNVKLEFFEPPAVPGFGAAGGFSVRLLDQTNSNDYQRLGEVTDDFMKKLGERKELKGLFTFFASNYPQYEIVINNDVAMQKGVTIGNAMDNLSIVIGSTWEQGFVRFGQFYKVYVQAGPEFRRFPEDFNNLFVKNDRGEMVPYSSFTQLRKKQGLNEINRYNLYPSAAIQGAPAKGFSSGQAIQAIKDVAKTLPPGYDIGWEGLSYDEADKGNAAVYILGIVVVFVYLVLVGQYESFLLPLAVIFSLPVGLFGTFLLLQIMGLSNDVYAQIGLVMLVGLLGKNAILIVEFAVQRRQEGLSIKEAAIEGGKLRFRPILMTSFAFIAGLLPLVVATGPGAIGNRTIGTAAVGGMLVGTVFGVVVIPGLYYLFAVISEKGKLLEDEEDGPLSEHFHRAATAAHGAGDHSHHGGYPDALPDHHSH